MKKFAKRLAAAALVVTAVVGLSAFAGCSTSYEGEYTYENYSTTYGIKVSVTLDGNDDIKSVKVVDSDYVEVSSANPDYGWTEEKVTAWTNGLDGLLANYAGKSAAEVMAQYVACADSGEPYASTVEGFVSYDSELILSGATQGSGRLLLAVQNALEGAGYKSYVGEYKYENAWVADSYYGIKVNVVVKDSTIQKVAVIDSDYVSVTSSWENKTTWENGLAGLLAKYEGKTVSAIKALTVATETDGTPTIQSSESFVSYDSDLLLSGATQGSGRLLLAVQNAIKSL